MKLGIHGRTGDGIFNRACKRLDSSTARGIFCHLFVTLDRSSRCFSARVGETMSARIHAVTYISLESLSNDDGDAEDNP